MPIALVLDTNVIRQEGLASTNMQRLARLAGSGEVAIYVPEIVSREFLSQRVLEVREQAKKCAVAVDEMGKQVGTKSPLRSMIADLKTRLGELEERTLITIPQEFERWMASCKVTQLIFDGSDMKEVLNDYFDGKGAFRRPKHRDDIPDAIASASMRPLLKTNETVHVAIKDGVFKKHLQSEPKYVVIDSLSEFFGLAVIKTIVGRLDASEGDVSTLKSLLTSAEFQSRLTAYLCQARELLEQVYVEEDDIQGAERMGIDGAYGFSVNYAQSQAISDIQYLEVSYITSGHFTIGLTIRTKARIDFAASLGAIQDIPTSRDVEERSMNGDGICSLSEVRDVLLVGHVELNFDPQFDAITLEIHSKCLATAASKIDVELDIREASIL